jgi:hypothetical protein
MKTWKNTERPGYFGRRRDEKVEELNARHGRGDWRLRWILTEEDPQHGKDLDFISACVEFYEKSYVKYFESKPLELDFVCTFGECIDNATTNIKSGTDYAAQESWATHIQDIAIRNVLRVYGRKFRGSPNNLLVIRSTDSNGFRFGPGNVPFYRPELITQPSLAPSWANKGSVEDFWQSNKWIQVYGD